MHQKWVNVINEMSLFMRKKCLTSNSNKRCMCSESSSSSLHKKEHMGLTPSVCGARLFTSQSSQHINNTTISRQMCITRQQLPVNFMIFVVLWAQENPFKKVCDSYFFLPFSNFLICDLAINTNETKIRFLHGSRNTERNIWYNSWEQNVWKFPRFHRFRRYLQNTPKYENYTPNERAFSGDSLTLLFLQRHCACSDWQPHLSDPFIFLVKSRRLR